MICLPDSIYICSSIIYYFALCALGYIGIENGSLARYDVKVITTLRECKNNDVGCFRWFYFALASVYFPLLRLTYSLSSSSCFIFSPLRPGVLIPCWFTLLLSSVNSSSPR